MIKSRLKVAAAPSCPITAFWPPIRFLTVPPAAWTSIPQLTPPAALPITRGGRCRISHYRLPRARARQYYHPCRIPPQPLVTRLHNKNALSHQRIAGATLPWLDTLPLSWG